MPDDEARGRSQGQPPSSGDDRLEDRLRALSRRLEQQEQASRPPPEPTVQKDVRGLAQALRLSSEFVAGTIVGVGLGWGFDHFLGTSPWGLIVFTLLGFSAGVLNMMRAVGLAPSLGQGVPKRPRD